MFFICLFGVFVSCQKGDAGSGKPQKTFLDSAKTWFAESKAARDLTGTVDWTNASIIWRKNGKKYLEVPVMTEGQIQARISNSDGYRQAVTKNSMCTYSKLLMYWDGGSFKYFVMRVSEDASSGADVSKVSFAKLPAGFTGYIHYTDIKGSLYEGYGYKGGRVTQRIRKPLPRESENARLECITVTTDYYQQVCIGDKCSEWTYLYSTTTVTCISTPDQASDRPYDPDAPGDCFECGGGSTTVTTTSTPYIVQDIFTSDLVSPCFINVMHNVNQGGLQNSITKILCDIFDKPGNLHIRFGEDSLSSGIDGTTDVNSITSGTGPTQWYMDVTLNKKLITQFGASKEYVAATILHEILHAYFMATSANKQKYIDIDHNNMGLFYIDKMADGLQEIYSTLSRDDAVALAWGGVHESYSWSRLVVDAPAEANRILQANNDYKNGISGTKCK